MINVTWANTGYYNDQLTFVKTVFFFRGYKKNRLVAKTKLLEKKSKTKDYRAVVEWRTQMQVIQKPNNRQTNGRTYRQTEISSYKWSLTTVTTTLPRRGNWNWFFVRVFFNIGQKKPLSRQPWSVGHILRGFVHCRPSSGEKKNGMHFLLLPKQNKFAITRNEIPRGC